MKVNPVVGLLALASREACFGMEFTSFLKKHYTPVTLRYCLACVNRVNHEKGRMLQKWTSITR